MRRVPATDEKPLHWVGSSKRDFLSFPAAVKEDYVDLVARRLRTAEKDYEEHYGKPKR